jgi:hypothetical protein
LSDAPAKNALSGLVDAGLKSKLNAKNHTFETAKLMDAKNVTFLRHTFTMNVSLNLSQ